MTFRFEDLMRFVKGPDFPTGGIIIQDPQAEGLSSIYGSGKGKVIVQARVHLEEMERGKNRIIVTELPYMVNKSSLIERIADLVRDGFSKEWWICGMNQTGTVCGL